MVFQLKYCKKSSLYLDKHSWHIKWFAFKTSLKKHIYCCTIMWYMWWYWLSLIHICTDINNTNMHLILLIPLKFINLSKSRTWWKIKRFFYFVNFWTNGMILFLEISFGTWYKGGLFSLILCKQFIHMYDVELCSIWIKYIYI